MLDEQEPKPWDQLPGESDAAYARFLAYRNLGPSRSLASAFAATRPKATKGNKRQQAPGQWGKDSSEFEWSRRADAWDADIMMNEGREVVLLFVRGLQQIARKAVAALEKGTVEPSDWNSAVSAINTVGQFVPGEAVAAIQANRSNSDRRLGVGTK